MKLILKPSRLSGIIQPESTMKGLDRLETLFWLLSSTFGNDVSVQGINSDFLIENSGFFHAMQKFGFSLASHQYGHEFCGFYTNSVSLTASVLGDCIPMVAIAGCFGYEMFTIDIDDISLLETAYETANIISALHVGVALKNRRLEVYPRGKTDGGQPNVNISVASVYALSIASLIADGDIIVSHAEELRKALPQFFGKLEKYQKRNGREIQNI